MEKFGVQLPAEMLPHLEGGFEFATTKIGSEETPKGENWSVVARDEDAGIVVWERKVKPPKLFDQQR